MGESSDRTAISSRTALWAGRVISAVCVLFLLLDSIIHVMNVPPVVEAFAKLGFPDSLALTLGVLELVCIALYVIPRTSILGAILLTGYLGGATALQVRISGPAWFSILLGVLIWAALFLRDQRVRELIPLRR
jgi:hypothetical protein